MGDFVGTVISSLTAVGLALLARRDRKAGAAAKARVAALEDEKAQLEKRIADLEAENRELASALEIHRGGYLLGGDGGFGSSSVSF
jgi:cell division protein FtsB